MSAQQLGDQPIHPLTPEQEVACLTDCGWGTPGLTKRELFAAMAMQGILGNAYWNEHGDYTPEGVAKSARDYADALLAELAKGGDA